MDVTMVADVYLINEARVSPSEGKATFSHHDLFRGLSRSTRLSKTASLRRVID